MPMTKRRFICDRCRMDFELEVLEQGEAERKGIPTTPVCCLKCGGPVRPK